jgi:hypothetical protein
MNTRHALATIVACVLAVGCSQSPTAPGAALITEPGERNRQAPKGPIAIVQGSIVVDYRPVYFDEPEGHASLRGTHGFKLDATPGGGARFPGSDCRFGECPPGSTIPLGGWWGGIDLHGTATLQGQTYELTGWSPPFTNASLELFATVVAPPQAATATLSTPFSLEGILLLVGATHQFEGRGIATVSLAWNHGSWAVSGVRYDFRGQSGR